MVDDPATIVVITDANVLINQARKRSVGVVQLLPNRYLRLRLCHLIRRELGRWQREKKDTAAR
jgi:hypothetical protein